MNALRTVTAVVWVAVALTAVRATNLNRYGKQQLAQKQNHGYGGWSNRGWVPSAFGSVNLRGGRYPASTGHDYFGATTSDVLGAYDPRPYDGWSDYAVVRYPSYATGYYYPLTELAGVGGGGGGEITAAYDDRVDDSPQQQQLQRQRQRQQQLLYGGGEDDGYALPDPATSEYYPSSSSPSSPSSSSAAMAAAAAAYSRYALNARYEPPRYPTDKIHKFRKVFMSNLVSPSNAFKSPKEQQLYDFWESLIKGDLQDDGDDDDELGDSNDVEQRTADRDRSPAAQQQRESGGGALQQIYQHLPSIFQQLQLQQLKQEQRDRVASSSQQPFAVQSVPRGNLYKQWANGSPLIKRSSVAAAAAAAAADDDDVRQLENLKTDADRRLDQLLLRRSNRAATATATATTAAPATTTATATTTTTTMATTTTAAPMADGGQREYVLPRPAGEKSSFESLLEVIAEGGLRANVDKNTAAYKKVSYFIFLIIPIFFFFNVLRCDYLSVYKSNFVCGFDAETVFYLPISLSV